MFLVYQPEGSEEPQRWSYNPRKLMDVEREVIERRTEMTFAEFTQAVVKGSSLARRALLFVMLKREHPTTKYDDVHFLWDELKLEYSKQEYDVLLVNASDELTGETREGVLEKLREEQATAFEDTELEGKVQPPVVG
ncbi:hypothetical protein [Streptomyces sp. H39-C1]|uniref:hypothetical protein n=1 Tax=Streptomyces sp. H39-C1 TaxID=3004355 RepID=UPI0022B06A21|nr:hypothetical protein [Streptomyces sp. H39-C1]MCZ4099841.1 hypothetical protein [Streptomyces sp. H39-C1]